MKKLLTFALLAALVLAGCKKDDPAVVQGVRFVEDKIVIGEDETVELQYTVRPAAANQEVTFRSSNPAVASVSGKGAVKGLSIGKATITVTTAEGGKKDECAVTVSNDVNGVTLSLHKVTVGVNGMATLTATVTPAKAPAADKAVEWKSLNSAVATVANGTVKGVARGEAAIVVSVKKYPTITDTCRVTVDTVKRAVTGVTVSPATLTVSTGATAQLTATVTPADASDQTVTWSSSAPAVAAVNAATGLVSGKAAGSAVVTATTKDGGKTATCSVTVIPDPRGDGTAANPYRIATIADLKEIGTAGRPLSAHYRQTANIDGSTFTARIDGTFTGVYDGGGYAIDGIKATLFQTIGAGGVVKSLGLTNVDAYHASLTGYNLGTVQYCYATGRVKYFSSGYDGGIASRNGSSGIIESCYTACTVGGYEAGGGIAGYNEGIIRNCYTTGHTGGYIYAGGITGYNRAPGTVQYCYAAGTVRGISSAGGIALDNGGTVKNCVALNPQVEVDDQSGSTVNRIAAGTGTLTNNYARSDMKLMKGYSAQTPAPALNGSDGASVSASTYGVQSWWTTAANWNGGAWNLTTVWEWSTAKKRPILRNVGGAQ